MWFQYSSVQQVFVTQSNTDLTNRVFFYRAKCIKYRKIQCFLILEINNCFVHKDNTTKSRKSRNRDYQNQQYSRCRLSPQKLTIAFDVS